MTDDALVAEVLAGSEAAFELLMQRHERLVYRVSYGFVRDRDDALDVTQEVFVRAYEKLATYRGDGEFRAWLLSLTRRANLNWLRRRRRDRGREPLAAAADPTVAARQEADLAHREEVSLVLDELSRLNPRQCLAVSLRYLERMPVRQIAAALECSEGVAKNILFRSLQKLRERLGATLEIGS
ncbi:MAG: sigma-70 family RNA polymerase sigma factor [Candidatus Krumholzibacteriota bacterium]|nr:sigma-70 family RNA polymerase sigma factor [Candidatus Krumholzibacteriota bacterium]